MKVPLDDSIKDVLKKKFSEISELLDGDIFNYYGQIHDGYEKTILKLTEDMVEAPEKKDKLFVILTTGGGSATAVERYVNIFRHHYDEVNFIVPDYAFSAGTIFCMSGDDIYMDYYSVLGPIDPQIKNKEGKWVAALGYLDKINELIEKAKTNTLTQAEFIILKDFDLAELKGYEQAKELTISLLKKWLVKYKFKNWEKHQTNQELLGQPVTEDEKKARAEEIADLLSDNNQWKSHGRPINIETLENDLRLKIKDYSKDKDLQGLIREYYDLMSDYANQINPAIFVQTKCFI
ncbi:MULTISPECIES: SDH family Clp fold serine proteinase [Flavobacteriaceae]|uniref:SDH family Clp fold serine proteinase n=1 Tax=Flavobacteriaceae TaxID=49546 RepID=UPI002349C810|nr:serine dehydrogenasease [Muricauda sp. SP22]MDC6362191.1 serine dehydrogenasease [Muricauda sp. SP22]